MPIHGRVIRYGIQQGAKYFPKTVLSIKRADVRIHKSLYGASGGRGVRHGRDIGSVIAGIYQGTRDNGDELDEFSTRENDGFTSGKKLQTYRGYKRTSKRYRKCYRPRRSQR